MADHAILDIPLVLVRPQIYEIIVSLERKGHQSIPRGCFRQTIRKPSSPIKHFSLNMCLFGALEPHEPFDLTATITAVLKMLGEQELFQGHTSILLQIFGGDEDSSILYVVHVLRPAHIIVFSVLSGVIHVVDHVHIGLEDVGVDDVAGEGEVVEARRKEQHVHGVFVVEGQVKAEILLFVVLVVADHLTEEHVVLEGGHVEVAHFQAARHEVVRLEAVGKLWVHGLGVPDQGEIEEAVGVGADYVVEEVEVEVLVH